MSQENVERVRRMVELFNSESRQATASFDEDVQFMSAFTERKTYHGLDGMRKYRP